jgi:type IV pilus secretin PilQ/predicted competence protein
MKFSPINNCRLSPSITVVATILVAMLSRCATPQQADSQSLGETSQQGASVNGELSNQEASNGANVNGASGQTGQNSTGNGNFTANENLGDLNSESSANTDGAINAGNSVNVNSSASNANELGLANLPVQSNGNQLAISGNGQGNSVPLNSGLQSSLTPQQAAEANNTSLPQSPLAESVTVESSVNKAVEVSNLSTAATGNPQGVLTWVGYNYNKEDKKLDVQIVTEGSPVYKIFKEKNRAGQVEMVVRYLNTNLRSKVRRDIDASEFRSPVAYIRMRNDRTFNYTDIVMTLRDEIEPTAVTKGSSLMLSFVIPDRWFAPVAAQVPVSTAEVVEDAPVEGMPVLDRAASSEDAAVHPYIDNPGEDTFKNSSPESAKKLVPRSDESNELVPEDKGAEGDKFLRNDTPFEFNETRYTVKGVAQANFSSDIPAGGNAAADLIEDMPMDLGEPSQSSDATSQLPAPSTAQPAGTDVVGVDSSSGAAPSSKKVMRLDFRDAPVSQVIKMIAAESDINFIISPEAASKKTSISLKNVAWDVALKAVLESNSLGMQELSTGLVRIDFLENFAKDHEAAEKARQATEALVPTKVMIMPLSYLKATDAATMVREMLPKGDQNNAVQQRSVSRFKVQAEPRSNSLVIEATPNFLSTAKTLLERLDTQTPQVRIQSRLVEFSKTNSDGLGVKWDAPFNMDAGRGLGFGSLPFPNSLNSMFAIDPGGAKTPGGSLAVKLGSINNFVALDLRLKAYETKKMAETLQTQDVVVQDNEDAEMRAGTTDFFPATAGVGAVAGAPTEIKYELVLKVTPHITADGAVQMKLNITGDDPKDAAGTALTSKTSRSLSTTLLKRSGETAVIGGLYTSNVQLTELGVPFLGRIPLIGALFRSKDKSNSKKDLLIMVTPTILGSSSASTSGATGASEVPTIDAGAFGASNASSGQMGENNVQQSQQSQQESQDQQSIPAQTQGNGQQSGQSSNASLQSDVL